MQPARPATLSPHGTWVTPKVCTNECTECGPVRARILAVDRNFRQRQTAASREGKARRGAS